MSGLQSQRRGINLLLVLLVAGLGAVAWWFVNKPDDQPERLLPLQPEDIDLITLERSPGETKMDKIRFEKQAGIWKMVAPRQVAANPVRLRQLFTFLNETVVASYDAAGKDLKQYGLLPGRATLRFNQQQFVLGVTNAVSNNRYVLHDNKIKLVAETIFGSVTGNWVNFVSLRLVPDDKKITSVTLPAAYESGMDLVGSWQKADAIRLEAVAPDKVPGKLLGEVILNFADKSQQVFQILRQADEWVLMQPDRGIRYFIPAAQADNLLPGLAADAVL